MLTEQTSPVAESSGRKPRRWIPKLAAAGLIILVGWLNYRPAATDSQVSALAQRFSFERVSLNDVLAEEVAAAVPLVAERFQHLESWLTAFLPTAAALADLDGDGYYDEACTTDGFSRKIRVHQLPRNGVSLTSFELPVPPGDFGVEGVLPTGVLAGDYNADGKTDLLVYFWGRTPVIFLNEGEGLSADGFRRIEVVEPVQRWYTQSMTSGDIDGDGDLDLIVGNYFPDDAKILNDSSEGDSLMNNGLGAAFNGEENQLLLKDNDSAVSFSLVEGVFADQAIGGKQWTIATALTDLDGDLLPEVFFLNDHGTDRILHNRSAGGELEFALLQNARSMTTTKSSTFGRDDYHAMGVDFADLNQDGNIDWLISNFGADYLFHQSHFVWMNSGVENLYTQGKAPFTDESERLGLSRTNGVPWDVRCVDFDNDGRHEIFRSVGFMRGDVDRTPEFLEMGLINDVVFQYPEAWHKFGPHDGLGRGAKPNVFCVWNEKEYTDIGAELGFHEAGPSRGMAPGDIDFDGRMDYLVTNQRASSTFYHNSCASPGKFVGLDVRLIYQSDTPESLSIEPVFPFSNRPSRPAVGASVTLLLGDGRKVATVVDGGSGFGGKRSPCLHFGLGEDYAADSANFEISWRDLSGTIQNRTFTTKLGWNRIWLGENSTSE